MIRAGCCLALVILLVGCVRSSGGPDSDRPERFEFIPTPANTQEFEQAISATLGSEFEPVDGSFRTAGQYSGPQGPMVIGHFEAIDGSTGEVMACTGRTGPFRSGVGCGPKGGPSPSDFVDGAFDISSTDYSDGWAEVEFTVTDQVAEIALVADDGTTYRLVPIESFAWMEWKTERGNLVATAIGPSGNALETVEVDTGEPE